jgi:hypothetical protein
MKQTTWLSILLGLVFVGSRAYGDPVPEVHAARTATPPALDGTLDDACWQAAKPITGFKKYGGNEPDQLQSIGYIAYDDENFYVAMRCQEPNPGDIASAATQPSEVFNDDSVEVFVKPHGDHPHFYQFAVSASGMQYDGLRFAGGGGSSEWSCPMDSATAIGADHWSVEIRIPLYALELSPGVTSSWRVNLCRNKKRPDSMSAIGRDGLFIEPHKYAVLKGMDLDYGAYGIQVGRPLLVGAVGEDGVAASATVSLENEGDTERSLKLDLLAGENKLRSEERTLAAGQEMSIDLGAVKLKAASGAGAAVFEIAEKPAATQLVVADASTGERLALTYLQYPNRFTVVELDVNDPKEDAEGERPMRVEVISGINEADRKAGSIQLTVTRDGHGQPVSSHTETEPDRLTRFTIDRATLPAGRLNLQAAFLDAGGNSVAKTGKSFLNLATRESGGKVLNNLVTELLNLNREAIGAKREFTFTNPREGWVFFATTCCSRDIALALEDDVLINDQSDLTDPSEVPIVREAMRWLEAGDHAVTLTANSDPALDHLVIRAIPELSFFRFPASTQLPQQQPVFTWDVLQKHVLHSYNAISVAAIMGREPRRTEDKALLEEWRDAGKRWLMPGLVPAYKFQADTTADKAYGFWKDNMAYSDPIWNGIIVDEFGVGDYPSHTYGPMAEAVRRLTAEFPDKLFYPFCMSIAGVKEVKPLMEATIDNGAAIVWEWYEREEPDLESAKEKLASGLSKGMQRWRDFILDAPAHMIICLGYYSTPPISLNENPAVDYKVWKDMQYHLAATHPSFEGLGGLMEWNSKYADEETVRWIARLHRHYAIEGKTNLLSDEYGFRYELPHLLNPDFDDGMEGWTVAAAEAGSVNRGNIPALGRLEGRVRGSSRGDNFARMKRSATKPNRISQQIVDLEPGKLYTLKMITADYNHYIEGVVEKQKHAVDIRIDNVELIEDRGFQEVMQSGRGQEAPPFSRDRQPWFNYYWKLFRAMENTAHLTVSDWTGENDPGGPVGRELLYNFIELQPYYDLEPRS